MTIPAGDCRSTTSIAIDESCDDLLLTTHVKQIEINELDLKWTVSLMR